MTILGVRSVALSTDTSGAWRTRISLARRGQSTDQIMARGFTHVLNLGKSTFKPDRSLYPDTTVWNHGEDIRCLLWPGATRTLLGDLMPPRPEVFPADVWLKAPGAHGRGKYKKQVEHALVLPEQWDWQEHISGQEYRLVTVDGKVVQDFVRRGGNGNRSYEWIRMREVPTEIKDMARQAASRLNGKNVIAWDLIQSTDGQAYLFEGNTCPGVNAETVNRIVTQMEGINE